MPQMRRPTPWKMNSYATEPFLSPNRINNPLSYQLHEPTYKAFLIGSHDLHHIFCRRTPHLKHCSS